MRYQKSVIVRVSTGVVSDQGAVRCAPVPGAPGPAAPGAASSLALSSPFSFCNCCTSVRRYASSSSALIWFWRSLLRMRRARDAYLWAQGLGFANLG